ncbi:TetR/AcrR family transcriptional regulator [Streptomyces gamaensis]|uniref:TetR/AcrR family transcriptional regulator n=1 Tax=Streptomyces gamaensis TaxID=1763542 RepID=A0ABW0Z552_9ACTN
MQQAERGERILEAAGELLVAWGYRRVTIDEIARRAEVGKGTVYLHWKTKDSLLLAVVLNAKWHSHRRQLERMRADPLNILPSRMMLGFHQDFLRTPVLRALHTSDSDILGRLNDAAKKEFAELMELGDQVTIRTLEVLREHGLVRTDDDVRHQYYALMAIATGFFMTEALMFERAPDTPEARGGILAETVRRALETSADHPAVTAAAPEVIALFEQIEQRTEQELRRQLRD